MKEAIQAEKDIFTQRLVDLKAKTLEVLRSMVQTGQGLFQKIENLIAYSFKREIDAMEEMGLLIRQKIEEESKI